MLQIIKLSCLSVVMLVSFLLPAAHQLGHGHIPQGLSWLIRLLWDPAALLSFGGIVSAGLLAAYGKHAVRPWFAFNCRTTKPGGTEQAEAISILRTAQKLVIISGLTMFLTRILFALGNLNQSIEVIGSYVGSALVCLIHTGLISLLLIAPVRACWESPPMPRKE